MKKTLITLFAIFLFIGLSACGGGEEVTLPTKPEQLAVPTRPVTGEPRSGKDTVPESTEAIDPTGETYPWEAEFQEDDYFSFEMEAPNGDKFVSWREGNAFGTERRNLYEWIDTGVIRDEYYYPSGNPSHSYEYQPDGIFIERHFLDNGYTDLEKMMTVNGTMVYFKQINPDGTWHETHTDENGNITHSAGVDADGTHWENNRCEDGTTRSVLDNPSTGDHSESEYGANGNLIKSISSNSITGECSESEFFESGSLKFSLYKSADGTLSEQEYYENGNMKHVKNQSPEQSFEEKIDEEGFRTYYYTKGPDWEQECIADETGKLVKVVENGVVKEDAATLAQYAKDYNFRE